MAPVSRVLTIAVLMVALLQSSRPVNVASQPTDQLQPHFNQAIIQVHRAESAGATTDEVAKLAALLNKALELNQQALALTRPEDAQKRAQFLTQVEEILDSVQGNATQLEVVASQRTFTNNVLAYVSGGIAAFIATLAYAYGLSFWRKYRVKRTFQMKVIPK
jgi:hypothetical protein